MTRRLAALALALCAVSGSVDAAERSRAVTREFERAHPCPSTGRTSGACPGWIKDHVIPLCAGGPDSVENMQWQTVADAKVKDRTERQQCRRKTAKSGAGPPRRISADHPQSARGLPEQPPQAQP